MAPKFRFTEGEKVLCYHGPLLYEAKCLKAQMKDKVVKYFIHYSGWNKNWDEWVPEARVMKYNETNLQRQKELEKLHLKSKKSKSVKVTVKKEVEKEPTQPEKPVCEKPSKPKPEKKVATTPPEQPPESHVKVKKEKPCPEPCFLDDVKVEKEIKICIPQALRDWLIDDWDLIIHQKKILHLPARVTVDHVIASYVKEKVSVKNLSTVMENTIVHIANKIRDCFNILLGKLLLYKLERQQYAEVLAEYNNSYMCEIYGAIHLARMFTKIGGLLTYLSLPERGVSSLVEHLDDFARYISANCDKFFSLDDYEVATPEYHRRAL